MSPVPPEPTPAQLLAIINTQTEIAKLGLDLHDVMELVTQRAETLTSAAGAAIELAEGDEMVYRAASGIAANQLGMRLNRSGSLSGMCVETGAVLRCDDSEADARVDRDACRRVGLRSMLVVPLAHNGTTVGVLKVLSVKPEAFKERDVRVLQLMSELIAASMFHATKYAADELFLRASRDSLTGLANRALFYDRLHHSFSRALRVAKRFALMIIDMDGLKYINDRFGHRVGDAAIKEFADRLSSCARKSDVVARLGGDEFGVILTDIEAGSDVAAVIQRLEQRFAEPCTFEDNALPLAGSVGVAVFPEHGEKPDVLVEAADRFMYAAKREKHRRNESRKD